MRGCSAIGVAKPRRRRGVVRGLTEDVESLTDQAAGPSDRNIVREAATAMVEGDEGPMENEYVGVEVETLF
jgi:hypothetical protein